MSLFCLGAILSYCELIFSAVLRGPGCLGFLFFSFSPLVVLLCILPEVLSPRSRLHHLPDYDEALRSFLASDVIYPGSRNRNGNSGAIVGKRSVIVCSSGLAGRMAGSKLTHKLARPIPRDRPYLLWYDQRRKLWGRIHGERDAATNLMLCRVRTSGKSICYCIAIYWEGRYEQYLSKHSCGAPEHVRK